MRLAAFGRRAALAAAVTLLIAARAERATATLATSGFRAVGVAHSAYPLSALAVAPDGRLFAAVQAKGQTSGSTPGTAEIRVYSAYSTGDGAILDEGTVWATVDNLRATTVEEGLLGLALAPDFVTSRLVYVYLTTTDETLNQHVRVYRENVAGLGEYLGTVHTGIEPPVESANRNGGPLAFGVDGCLYLGVGDNGNGNRWNAQLLRGTEAIQANETTSLCTSVCRGPALYPARTVQHNGAANHAGKILRMAVEGASPVGPAPGAPLASQPFVFGTGMRNPTGLSVHPLTGQLYALERGETLETELDVVDRGTNQGWPCIEGRAVPISAACLAGMTVNDVYVNHPEWRRPLATHTGNPVVSGLAAYTGLAYPGEYYGDLFYLLRDSARLYRLDLEPPCFLPHPNGVTPVAFHDSAQDGDFVVLYDIDGDGDYENIAFPNLIALAEGPDALGQRVLYVAGKQGNGNALTDDTMIFRIEFATAFTPYAGALGRVPDVCFSDGVYAGGTGAPLYGYENPFLRETCLAPGGVCPGQPDGTPCDDGDTCNGAEACQAGICTHGPRAADGTPCAGADRCRSDGVCQAGSCAQGPALADGTPCPDADPCNGLETCAAGLCRPGSGGPSLLSVRALTLKRSGALSLVGSITPAFPVAPAGADDVTLELRGASGPLFTDTIEHPASDLYWRRMKSGSVRYTNWGDAGGLGSVALRTKKSGAVQVAVRGRRLVLGELGEARLESRFVVGDQCFAADLACTVGAKKLRCHGQGLPSVSTTTTQPPPTSSTTTTSTTTTTTTTTTSTTTTTTTTASSTTTTTTSSTTTTQAATTSSTTSSSTTFTTTTSSTTTTEPPTTTSTTIVTTSTTTTSTSSTTTTTETTTTTLETTTTTLESTTTTETTTTTTTTLE